MAGEVRSLAQRSAAAAKEIKNLIEEAVRTVGQGNELVGDAGNTMEEVVASIEKAASIMHDITRASREQGDGINQVNLAMTQLDAITRQNAALVEESAAASSNVAQEATRLAQALSVFKMDEAVSASRRF